MTGKLFLLCLACCFAVGTQGCRSKSEVDKTVPNQNIKTVMEAHVDELMGIPNVTAVGIGVTDDGTPCVRVYVVEETEETKRRIPTTLDDHPVVVVVSGEIEPMKSD